MSHKDDMESKKELWRITSPEFRLAELIENQTELIEKLSQRVVANEEEAGSKAEENQRTIDFILRQQAQFNADMQQLRESQARSEQRWERTEGGIRALLSIAEIHQQEIGTLKESQAQTDRQMKETDERFKETGERLNALIDTVERIISGRRNGGGRATEGGGPLGEGQR